MSTFTLGEGSLKEVGASMNMLLYLKKPGHLLIGDNLHGGALTAQGLHHYGRSPVRACSDMLLTSNGEFVGLVLYTPEADAETAQRFAAASDPCVVRHLSNAEASKLPRYHGLRGRGMSALELRWSSIEPDRDLCTQLVDFWYCDTPHPTVNDFPSAWGYPDVNSLLAGGYTIPESHF